MIKFRKHTLFFILIDFITALISWFIFYRYRKVFIEPDKYGYEISFTPNSSFYLGLCFVSLYWIFLYAISGSYNDVWRKSRIREISTTFSISALGVIVLFFALLLDDEVGSYKGYYKTVFTLFSLHFGITLIPRLFVATWIKRLINAQKIGFKTLVIGNDLVAKDLTNELQGSVQKQGYLISGFVSADGGKGHMESTGLINLGAYNNIPQLIKKLQIEEVIIALPPQKHDEVLLVNNLLQDEPVIVKIVPDVFDVLSGSVKMRNVLGTVLIEINHEILPQWQRIVKRFMDVFASLCVLVVFSPLYLFLALLVKFTSKGAIFFKQERIGIHGKPFYIIKYRTMYEDAEVHGPALSSKNDKRITPVGRVLRKYRLDEIPQFYNVLIGDMSLVGPRPERQFFIDQIIKVAPYYKHLHRVKPGITSWGMVKFGYAENIDEMVARLKFDILYIENMSLAMDFRIMIYTVKTIIQGRGK